MSSINTKWPYPVTEKEHRHISNIIREFDKPDSPIIFIGAGFGKEAIPPLPTGKELGLMLREELGIVDSDEDLPKLLQYLKNDNAGSRRVVIDWLKDKLLYEKSKPGGAHRLLLELPCQEILTTNYDLLLPDASRQMNYRLKIIVNSSSFNSSCMDIKGHENSGVLGYLHGNFENEGIVATTDDYNENLVHQEIGWNSLIKEFFKNRTVVFIGYSLKDLTTWESYTSVRDKHREEMYPHYLVSPINSEFYSQYWNEYGIIHIPFKASQFLTIVHDKMGNLDTKEEIAIAAAAARIGKTYDDTIINLEELRKSCLYPDMITTAWHMIEEGLNED